MDREKTCCVTGHRDIPEQKKEDITQLLKQEILEAITDGYCSKAELISFLATPERMMGCGEVVNEFAGQFMKNEIYQ